MGRGLESRCVGRVCGADGVVDGRFIGSELFLSCPFTQGLFPGLLN